jgi:hypothetical protein
MSDAPARQLSGEQVLALRFAAHRHLARWSTMPGLSPHQHAQRSALRRGRASSTLDEHQIVMAFWSAPERKGEDTPGRETVAELVAMHRPVSCSAAAGRAGPQPELIGRRARPASTQLRHPGG